MITFSQRFNFEEDFITFYFNFCTTNESAYYIVSVVDRESKTYIFHMKEHTGKWVLTNPEKCPRWIVEMEHQLSDIILQHGSSQTT